MEAIQPVMPKVGTDNHRLLMALMLGPVTNPNRKLNLMAHSRASELRKLGWDVQVQRSGWTRLRSGQRKPKFVYSLAAAD